MVRGVVGFKSSFSKKDGKRYTFEYVDGKKKAKKVSDTRRRAARRAYRRKKKKASVPEKRKAK